MKAAIFGRNREGFWSSGNTGEGFDSLSSRVAKRILLFRKPMIFFFLEISLNSKVPFVFLGVNGSFFFRLPVRRLPFQIKISFYVVVKLLFLFIIFSLSRSVFLLFMDELTRAVAQFYLTLEGTNGEFGPPPAPCWGFLLRFSSGLFPGAAAPRVSGTASARGFGGSRTFEAPFEPYPYRPDEVIGGDSVRSIQSRLLAKDPSPSYEEKWLVFKRKTNSRPK